MKLNTFKTLFFTVLFLAITSVGFASIEDNKEGEEEFGNDYASRKRCS